MVCRLAEEKGIDTALAAWKLLDGVMPLKIVGDGPMAPLVRDAVARGPGIEWLGRRPLAEVCDLIGRAAVLVFPSRCYETFGRVIVEAFAKGTPVVASNMGAMADLVEDGQTGALFEPGNPDALAAQVRRLAASPRILQPMRTAARREYELRYTGAINHERLMQAYRVALGNRSISKRTVATESSSPAAGLLAGPAFKPALAPCTHRIEPALEADRKLCPNECLCTSRTASPSAALTEAQ
jgi:glycosyltransferase involved in cell wall biosynthesis